MSLLCERSKLKPFVAYKLIDDELTRNSPFVTTDSATVSRRTHAPSCIQLCQRRAGGQCMQWTRAIWRALRGHGRRELRPRLRLCVRYLRCLLINERCRHAKAREIAIQCTTLSRSYDMWLYCHVDSPLVLLLFTRGCLLWPSVKLGAGISCSKWSKWWSKIVDNHVLRW